jgi:hypothetical protein
MKVLFKITNFSLDPTSGMCRMYDMMIIARFKPGSSKTVLAGYLLYLT